MTQISELRIAVETLQNILIARATGEQALESDFKELRDVALNAPAISPVIPQFVRTSRSLGQFWGVINTFKTYRERREFIWEAFKPVFDILEAGASPPASQHGANLISVVDSPHVRIAWQSAFNRKDHDPEGAITSARTLVECVCKHILEQMQGDYSDGWDLPKLYKAAAEKLNLAPQQHNEAIFKQILGGCQTVVEGLAALRNKLGDAHGKGAKQIRPSPRHAGLAVHLAGGLAIFLIETFEERSSRPSS